MKTLSRQVSSMLVALLATFSAATAADLTLVPRGATWKYLDNNTNQGTAWKEPAFHDSDWAAGPAPLGFGDSYVVTTVQSGPTNGRYITTYFRRVFTVADPAAISALRINLQRDDGAIIYVNGVEIARDNLPAGAVDWQTITPVIVSGADETTYFPITPSATPLVAGVNIIAVELHQRDNTSSDLGFDMDLIATVADTPNIAPSVAMTLPADGATFTDPVSITLNATASDSDGSIAKVEFYRGGVKLGQDTVAPYECIWLGPIAGTHALTAVATDNQGLASVSSIVYATITGQPNRPPTVSLISPDGTDTYDAPSTIELQASAADTDGVVTKVEFFNGATKLGEDTTAPYSLTWSNVITGTYTLSVVATDSDGGVTTSAPVTLTVDNVDNTAPTVALTAPLGGATIIGTGVDLAATATDGDGFVIKVEFFQGANKLGEDATAPHAFSWTGVAPGNYTVTAKATDNDGGVTTSAPVAITVSAPPAFTYAQNFDGLGTGTVLGTASTVGWTAFGALGGANNTWTTSIPTTGTPSAATAGTASTTLIVNSAAATGGVSSNVSVYNMALAASTTDRCLGTSPTTGAGMILQLTLTNTTSSGISGLDIGYDTRRFTVAGTVNELPGYWLFYSLDNGATWTNVTTFNPAVSGATVNVPNTVGVTTIPPTTVSLSSVWAAGASIRFRWIDDNAVATSPDQIQGLDNVTIAATQFAEGVPPTVSLTAPANGAIFNAPASIALTATAADSDGSIIKVEFYNGSNKLGEVTTAPYTYNWTGVPQGTYMLTARAYDNSSNSTISSSVTVTVNAGAGSGTLTRGPYLNMANQNSIVIRWRSSQAVTGRVKYGTSPTVLDQTTDETASRTDHEVRLTGLTPYTRYYYSVGSALDTLTPQAAETTSFSPGAPAPTAADYTFRTSPVPGTAVDTRIWIVGDCGRGTQVQASGRDAYYSYNGGASFTGTRVPDLNLQMGDNAYNSGTDAEYQTGYYSMYANIFRKMPQWSTLGNHDANNGSTNTTANFPYFDMFTFPTAGECGGVASGTERYYSFDYGNIHFICLDAQASSTAVDNPATTTVNEDGPMAAWLRQDLASITATWIIAFWHHPPYSKGSHDSDSESQLVNMRNNFVPIMEAGGVDLLFFGHSHNYERSYLLDGHYGVSSTFNSTHRKNSGNGSKTGFTTGGSGVIRRAPNFSAVTTTSGTVIPADGAYIKPLTGPRDHFGAVYNTAGMSGLADAGSINHPAMYICYNTVGTVNLDINGPTLTCTYVQTGGTTPDNFTITKQGAADTDGDGIPDEWEIAHGLNRLLASDAALDPDGDGLSNLDEYQAGTDPKNAADKPRVGQIVAAADGSITLQIPTILDRRYRIEANNQFPTGTWSSVADNVAGTGGIVSVPDAGAAGVSSRIYRVKVTLP
jgi:hypothetical protein